MNVKDIIEKAQKDEYNYCKDNIEYFIQEYVHIEDRDSQTLATPFKLWEGQKLALKDFIEQKLNIVLKARQMGFTWLALAYACHEIIFNAGYQCVALSKTEKDAFEMIRRMDFILRYMPKWLLPNEKDKLRYTSTASEIVIHHPNNEPSIFTSLSASPSSGRSLTANLLVIDEWAFQQFAKEIWTAAYPTINRPNGGKVIGISTAKRMTLFEEIWKKSTAGLNNFNRIFSSWSTDPRRTQEWYEQTKQDLGEHQTKVEYPSTPEEAFDVSEGTAFPEYSHKIHVCKPFEIPDYWIKWRSGDNGYTDPFAFYWYALSDDGQVFVYREYTREYKDPKITYTDQARQVTHLTGSEYIEKTVLGKDAWNTHHRDNTGKALIDYYKEGGLDNCIPAVTDRAIRKATLHEYFKPYKDNNGNLTAKVQIFDTCTKLIETIPQLLIDDRDNEKVAECDYDHSYDSFGYGLIARHDVKSTEPPKPKPKLWMFESQDKSTGNYIDW